MGQFGVIPKRSDERIRRNKVEGLEKISAIGPVKIPRLNIPDAHPLVKDLYASLKNSAQSRFYEESDWQYARLAMYALNDMLKQQRISAIMLASINSMLTSLLVTEGDRRRVRLEVERDTSSGAKVLDIAEMFQQRLSQTSGNS